MKDNLLRPSRLNILLALTIAALIFVAIQKPGINNKQASNKIIKLSKDDIQNIDIISPDQKTIRLSKNNSIWTIFYDGKEIEVDQKKIPPLLSIINIESLDHFKASDQQLAQYHLANPRITAKFNELSVAFGATEPLKHRRYILVNGEVHLIADLHYHLLLQPAHSYLVDKK